jgi:hypothetical protein
MGHWGVKSYEIDEAADALDAGFDLVHGALYEQLMDDKNPLTFEEVQQRLADRRTLHAAIGAVRRLLCLGDEPATWDELARLALAGVVVRHAELGVPIPVPWLDRAVEWLEHETIDWEQATARRLVRQREIALLRRAAREADHAQPDE